MTSLSADSSNSNPQDDLHWRAPFRLHPRLNPSWLEQYVDTAVCAQRLIDLQQAGVVPDTAREAVNQFLKEFEILKAGKNPDGVDAFDDFG